MTKAKYHLLIESQRRGRDTYDTYYLMGVTTMPDGKTIYMDLVKETDLARIREIAKQRSFNDGCRVVEEI